MLDQDPRSLLERLEAHRQGGYLSLHMPGHKENTALAPYLAQLGAQWDITELPGFDDLHDPEGILAQAMDRAARLFGSRKSWLQVNGSTGGLLAAVRAATRRGDTVLVARHCHKAIYHALELCGLTPVFLQAPVVEGLGITGSLTPDQVAQALEAHPEARLLVYPSPTYDGVVSDTAGICAVAHAQGGPGAGGRGPRGPPGPPPRLPPECHGPGGRPGGGQPPQDPAQPHPDRPPPRQRPAGAPAPGGPADGDLPVQLPLLPADGLYGQLPAAAGGPGGRPSAPPGPGGWRNLTGRSRACGTSAAPATGRQRGRPSPACLPGTPPRSSSPPGTVPSPGWS